jgi:glutamine amidotransferase
MTRVAVIDYGSGNLGSMLRALEELGADAFLATRPEMLDKADRLILPGVGNFTACMGALNSGNWLETLRTATRDKKTPLLGVCVGMQLLASFGEEGAQTETGTAGLGLVPGRVVDLRNLGCTERLPHVGWNSISISAPDDPLFYGIPEDTQFYFVHSYTFRTEDAASTSATTEHDVVFTTAIRSGNVWGTQFHPEKSARAGFRVLRNFIELPPC